MLNEIRDELKKLDMGPVEYGRAKNNPDTWNYIVFARRNMRTAGTSKVDYCRYYTVAIVHEDYIPEGTEVKVMKILENIKGLKMSQEDIQYDYTIKKGSDTVVEMAVLTFVEPLKGYKL